MKNNDTKRLFPSYFLRVFERDELVALVHQLQPKPVYISKKGWQEIISCLDLRTQSEHSAVPELVSRKLFIVDPVTDQRILKAVRKQALQSLNRPTILYLMMAQGCNFACTYCPIPSLAKRYGEHLLTFENALAGIALWQKHIEEQPRDNDPYFLIFYGGEPLLNRGALERLLPYVAEEQSAGRLPQDRKSVV